MTWKSKTSGPVRRLWATDAPREPLFATKSLKQGPWALQPKPKHEPTTQEIPVLDGALGARERDKLDGLMDQMRFDLGRGHHLEAETLLRERLKACRMSLSDAEIADLAESLRDVDRARRLREEREAEEAAAAEQEQDAEGNPPAA
ncbi:MULTISPECIES: hypothetical protein [unclassified Microcella]|uniref:hypothetical protein n=1 Tax=unclassified Microcella TaxID=2630066 RepID=UPI0006F8B3A9|nr:MULTISPECIES: hypothetical protein [unclassified Microcella]KQV24802.1 hypothetical protein ASC54_09900 [Yonghaparkia sp. Root332]